MSGGATPRGKQWLVLGANMSFSLIGPWLHALWARSAEAGRRGTVNVHPGRVQPTPGRVAHGSGSCGMDISWKQINHPTEPTSRTSLLLMRLNSMRVRQSLSGATFPS